MFAYCNNNPVNMSDPSGNWPEWLINIFISDEDEKKIAERRPAEQRLAYAYPFSAMAVSECATEALASTIAQFPANQSDGTKANAFQHAYWNALLVCQIGAARTAQFATAHEDYPDHYLNATNEYGFTNRAMGEMDLYNNAVGRDIGKIYMQNVQRANQAKRGNAAITSFVYQGATISLVGNRNAALAQMVMAVLDNGDLIWLR
jgi:hypothetical protein